MDNFDMIGELFRRGIIREDGDCWLFRIGSTHVNKQLVKIASFVFFSYHPDLRDGDRPEFGRRCGNKNCCHPDHLYLLTMNDRFWEKVAVMGEDDCWNWTASTDGGGYGIFMVSPNPRIMEKAHRLSWMMINGSIPDGLYVLHACDNPACVNPNHLFLGTHLDNMKDKVSKGRQTRLPGEQNGRNILSEIDVRNIVRLHEQGMSYRKLSKKFGIGNTQIGRIIRKETWRWLWD